MKEYISKEAALEAVYKCWCDNDGEAGFLDYQVAIEGEPPADVKPVMRGENLAEEYADCDQFICSECGIHLQDWVQIDNDDDENEVVIREFVIRVCPNCGAEMKGAKKNERDSF